MRKKLAEQAQVVKLGPETDYGLFFPSEPGAKSGVWLDLELRIEDYMVVGGGLIKANLKSGVNMSCYHVRVECVKLPRNYGATSNEFRTRWSIGRR